MTSPAAFPDQPENLFTQRAGLGVAAKAHFGGGDQDLGDLFGGGA